MAACDSMNHPEALSILSNLTSTSRVVVCGHTRPDGDAIGSTLALSLALKARGVLVHPVVPDDAEPPASYAWLEGFDMLASVTELPDVASGPDLFIAVDCPHHRRLGLAESVMRRAARTLLIDHHPQNSGYADVSVVDRDAASTTQVIWDLMNTLGWSVTKPIATAALVGLVTDTGGFRYSNTSPSSLRTAAAMLQLSEPMNVVSTHLFESKSRALLDLESLVASRLELRNGGAVAVSWLGDGDFARLGALPHEGENLIDVVRTIGGPEVIVLVTLGAAGPRVSLRSKGDFDVADVAGRFGGGGHTAAAGVTWPDVKADLSAILDELCLYLPDGASSIG